MRSESDRTDALRKLACGKFLASEQCERQAGSNLFAVRFRQELSPLGLLKSCELKNNNQFWLLFFGAEDRTWTGTMLPPQDFKSCASAYSATSAYKLEAPSRFELEHKGFADLGLTAWLRCHYSFNLNEPKSAFPFVKNKMERRTGFEPATFALARRRSTAEPPPHNLMP